MVEELFVGVDGGGTKSKLRIENGKGETLGEAIGGPGSIRLSVSKSWQSVNSAFNDALKQAGLKVDNKKYRFHAGLGLAGCEIPEAYQQFINTPNDFSSLVLKSDAHAACLGAHDGEDGAIIIIGTGLIGYEICEQEVTRVGGWGFPQGDEGSGAWLGLEAVRLTLHWIDGRIEETPMIRAIFSEFSENVTQFISWSNYAKSTDFGRLAPIVIQHVHLQDPYAVKLIRLAAKNIDEVAQAMENRSKREDLPLCLFGGIAPHIEPWLSEHLRSRIRKRAAGATHGAMLMIKDQLGLLE